MYQFKLNFPVPKPDMEKYDKFLNTGFDKFPERKENYNKYKLLEKVENLNYMPIKADIENISRCNLKCSHCIVSTYKNQKRANDLSFDDFKKFIDEQYGLIEIKMQGLGEPFLQKDFTKMVKYATDKYIWVRTTTNGTLLHINENYKKIIDVNIGEIQVSIDGATFDTQSKIRKGSNLDIIKKNCEILNNYCEAKGVDYTRMWTVLQENNFAESEGLLYMAKEIGFKRVTFSIELREWEIQNKLNKYIQTNKVVNKTDQKWIDYHLEIAKKIGLDLSFWYATERFTKDNICMWPFERILLTSDMYIVPCCIIADPNIYNFDKYKIGKFKDLWFGEKLRNFRKSHLSNNIPDVCKNCYY